MDRTILHCDCNGFFASVECLLRPELKSVPMAVCGDPESRHGIILAKNEPAKKFGIRTAETVWQAKTKCPGLVLTAPRFREYRKYYRAINQIYLRYTDLVEPFSIDESWLDVTGSRRLFGEGKKIADELRAVVQKDTGLTISVGVSFNKIFAKMGSDYKKPDATTVISRENYKKIVFPLPVSALLFCGRKSEEILAGMGIRTIGELASCDRDLIAARLGKIGGQLHDYANGVDESPVLDFNAVREVKSVGNSITFRRDLVGMEDIRRGVGALADSVASRLRKQGVRCWVVQVGIKNPSLKSISRQKTLPYPTHLAKDLSAAAMELIGASWNPRAPIRLISLTGTSLVPEDSSGEQLCFFGGDSGARDRQEKLEAALDGIRNRFGKGAVSSGGLLNDDIGAGGIRHEYPEKGSKNV
jgi:DNA polymerase-4